MDHLYYFYQAEDRGKQSLKCVGKNPRLAQAKSRNDKNISGLLNQIEDNAKTGKIGIHTFTNVCRCIIPLRRSLPIIRIHSMCISGWSMAAVRLMWGDCIASVSGQAMAAGEAWDGKLEVEDYTTRFAIGGGLDVNGFRESLSMQMKETVNRGFEVYFAERAGISGFCRPVEMEGV